VNTRILSNYFFIWLLIFSLCGQVSLGTDHSQDAITQNRVVFAWLRCGNGCSGHGTCLAQSGAIKGHCACEAGYHGALCQNECPGGAATICSGHGICGSNGECTCAEGFWDTACDQQCPAGASSAGAAVACSGHGHCGDHGNCNCEAGYRGASCSQSCPGLSGTSVCTGHGSCNSAAKCACTAGFWGESCSAMCPLSDISYLGCYKDVEEGRSDLSYLVPGSANASYTLKSCRDACKFGGYSYFGRQGNGVCYCGESYGSNGLASGCECNVNSGVSIGTGKNCVYEIASTLLPCGGHGECNSHGDCECRLPFVGAKCDIQCPSNATGAVCSSKGTCNSEGGCQCNPGYWGDMCEHGCPAGTGTALQWCSGRGVCRSSGTCDCSAGFKGTACELTCPRAGSNAVCAGHGACTSAGGCSCEKGYYGTACTSECPGGALYSMSFLTLDRT